MDGVVADRDVADGVVRLDWREAEDVNVCDEVERDVDDTEEEGLAVEDAGVVDVVDEVVVLAVVWEVVVVALVVTSLAKTRGDAKGLFTGWT